MKGEQRSTKKQNKHCDALNDDHDWADAEVRCLTDGMPSGESDGDGRRRFTQRVGALGGDGRRRRSPSPSDTALDCRACWTGSPPTPPNPPAPVPPSPCSDGRRRSAQGAEKSPCSGDGRRRYNSMEVV
jgi:hypothetical protein